MGATLSANAARILRWGLPPWTIDFHSEQLAVPDEVDFAIVGGGFTGFAPTAWVGRLGTEKALAPLSYRPPCARVPPPTPPRNPWGRSAGSEARAGGTCCGG